MVGPTVRDVRRQRYDPHYKLYPWIQTVNEHCHRMVLLVVVVVVVVVVSSCRYHGMDRYDLISLTRTALAMVM